MTLAELFPVTILFQGDSWEISLGLLGYDPSIWTCTYVFRMAGQAAFTVGSTASNGSFLLASPSETTADYTPGRYTVTAVLTNATTGVRITAGQTEIEIKPDVSVLANSDPRSLSRRALDDIEAALAFGAGSDIQEYTVAGTNIKKNRAGLLALRAHFLKRVRTENGKPAIGTRLLSL